MMIDLRGGSELQFGVAIQISPKFHQSFSGIYLFQILKTGLILALYYNDRKRGERINKEKRNNKQFETRRILCIIASVAAA